MTKGSLVNIRTTVSGVVAKAVGKVALLRPYRKAIAGLLTPGIIAIGVAVINDSSPGGHAVTAGEWQGALVAMLATAGIVWKVRNKV